MSPSILVPFRCSVKNKKQNKKEVNIFSSLFKKEKKKKEKRKSKNMCSVRKKCMIVNGKLNIHHLKVHIPVETSK